MCKNKKISRWNGEREIVLDISLQKEPTELEVEQEVIYAAITCLLQKSASLILFETLAQEVAMFHSLLQS
jgi:hypothetical protein